MEYERALFRVYERCLDGFSGAYASSTIKVFRVCQSLSLAGCILFLMILAHLHLAFVNQPSCLPMLLNDAMNTTSYSLRRDHIVQITVDRKFAPVTSVFDADSTNSFRRLFSQNHTTNNSATNTTIKPDYEYAQLSNVLSLPRSLRESHDFMLINVTMSGNACFGSALTQALLPFGGVDTAILNAAKTTTHHSGYLKSSNNAYYHWKKDDLKPRKNLSDIILHKVGIVFGSCFAFFLLSTVTALLIRVLISSGVVLLFPLFWSLQCCGIHIFNSRIISLSYPWIGLPLEMLRARNQSTGPFIMGHIVRVLIFYFLYEASQIAISMWFYGHSFPSPRELWLFAIFMIWEYYTMIYVRSSLAILFFPRASFLLFLLYHFYLYSFPSGFHLLALLALFLALNWLMMITLLKIELPAYMRGDITFEQPRALFNAVPWPAWTVTLGPDFTLFMPVQYRSTGVYDSQPVAAARPAAPAPVTQRQEPTETPTRPRQLHTGSYERLETDESEDIESYQRQRPVRNPLALSSERDIELG